MSLRFVFAAVIAFTMPFGTGIPTTGVSEAAVLPPLDLAPVVSYAPGVPFTASGATAGDITATLNTFRTTLGTLNPNTAGSKGSGRREINWDGTPDNRSAPNALPADFFNVNSPRGVIFSTPGTGFQVSSRLTSTVPINFGNINASYSTTFQPFTPERLFTAIGSNTTDITFVVPGSPVTATVRGFGAVFSDVEVAGSTTIEYFNGPTSLGVYTAPVSVSGGFSFLGVDFTTNDVSRVRIKSGGAALGAWSSDNPAALVTDLVVMDDLIYGEPVVASTAFSATGINAAAITPTVDSYKTALGTLNPNTAGSVGSGRREINWDGTPAGSSDPNNLPNDFFNVNSPRGVVFSTPGTGVRVSANAALTTPVEFGGINALYPAQFAPFTTQKLFTPISSTETTVNFFIPGSTTAAVVRGFGAVFSDVDTANGASIEYFNGITSLGVFTAPNTLGAETFSFVGVDFGAPVVTRVKIISGSGPLDPGTPDISTAGAVDVVVMDDFIYGEPVAADLGLAVTAPATGFQDVPFTYSLVISNTGSGASVGTTVTSTLPTGLSFVTGTPGCLANGAQLSCIVGSIPVSSTKPVTISVKPAATGVLSTTFNASASVDSNPANNSASATTTIGFRAYLPVAMSGLSPYP